MSDRRFAQVIQLQLARVVSLSLLLLVAMDVPGTLSKTDGSHLDRKDVYNMVLIGGFISK
jgi:hypothetical protein